MTNKRPLAVITLMVLFCGGLGLFATYLPGPAAGGGQALPDSGVGMAPTQTCFPTGTPILPPTVAVDPVDSPTDQFFQVVTATVSGCDWMYIDAESGSFSGPCSNSRALITVALFLNTTHHLQVEGRKDAVYDGPCLVDQGYWTPPTGVDRFGNPLTIVQVWNPCCHAYLPVMLKAGLLEP